MGIRLKLIVFLVFLGILQTLSWIAIAFMPSAGSSIITIAALLALSNLGASVVDVANDALVAECGKKKSTGELQSFAWFFVAVGGIFGNLAALFALSKLEFRIIFGIFGVILVCQVCKSMRVSEETLGLNQTPIHIPRVIIRDVEKSDEVMHEFSLVYGKKMYSSSDAFPNTLSHELSEDAQKDPKYDAVKSQEPALKRAEMKQQLAKLIYLVKQPDILYAMSWYMASYAMIPTLSSTMFFFQTQHLKVDPSVIGLSKVIGQIGLMGGSLVYSHYSRAGMVPLRKILSSIQVLLCLFTISDIILVKRMNVAMGIPDVTFVIMGASAFVDAINQFKVLPFIVFVARLCPAGHEASLLAAFMSMQCLATIISGYMGVTLASMLHISSGDFSELPIAIFIQSIATLVPLFWISLIPDGGSNLQQRDGKKT